LCIDLFLNPPEIQKVRNANNEKRLGRTRGGISFVRAFKWVNPSVKVPGSPKYELAEKSSRLARLGPDRKNEKECGTNARSFGEFSGSGKRGISEGAKESRSVREGCGKMPVRKCTEARKVHENCKTMKEEKKSFRTTGTPKLGLEKKRVRRQSKRAGSEASKT